MAEGSFEMILPWPMFNGAPMHDQRFVVPDWNEAMIATAQIFYDADEKTRKGYKPPWELLSNTTKLLLTRNVPQVVGMGGSEKADMIVCWTEKAKDVGGTGLPIRLAQHQHIPVFNLADPDQCRALVDFVAARELERNYN